MGEVNGLLLEEKHLKARCCPFVLATVTTWHTGLVLYGVRCMRLEWVTTVPTDSSSALSFCLGRHLVPLNLFQHLNIEFLIVLGESG